MQGRPKAKALGYLEAKATAALGYLEATAMATATRFVVAD
jgi:hypothetical protein